MKLRVKYAKMGSSRFLSHLELMKAMERAFRRARIPLAFSEGFNPHPKISYASALSVGIASEGEYLDIELSTEMDIEDFKIEVNKNLINSLEILDVKEIKIKVESLTAIVERAKYRAICLLEEDIKEEVLNEVVKRFLDQEEMIVTRKTKDKVKEINIKEGIFYVDAEIKDMNLFFKFIVVTGSKGNVRAGEVYDAFISFGNFKVKGRPNFIREALYALKDDALCTPMDILEG
ncbi:MAG: hypothetical protein APF76_12925 [Desulfitibacter sp. BRH_c19]|nr:MAG: hypothetical protein APF76_12925 [Desulfitibacter sp. BRH_c19]